MNIWASQNWPLNTLGYLCNIHGEDTGKHLFRCDLRKLKIEDQNEDYLMKKKSKSKGKKRKTKTLAEANAMDTPKLKKGRAKTKY
jgi:hypothetical protein